MKPVRLLIAVVLLAGLGGALWWSNKNEAAKEGKPDQGKDAPPKILSISPDMVKQIDIKRREGESTSVHFTDQGKWELTSPKVLAADPAAIASITSTASNLTSERVVDENATDLATYGLAPAVLEITFKTKDDKTTKLLIGEKTPTESSVYAKVDGDPRLFAMAAYSKSVFDKVARDLRDKRLLSFVQDKISRIELTARKETFEFGKTGETDWQVVKPRVMRANSVQVEDLITKLKGASMDPTSTEESAKKDVSTFAGATPIATVKVTDSAGTQSLEIRKAKDDYYAKSSSVEGVYKVGKDLGDALDKPMEEYRNRKLFDFGFSDPSKIDVKDGDKTLALQKGGEKWLAPGNKEMDNTSVQAFIDRLRDLTTSTFVDKGFTTPVLTISVISNNGKRTEKLEISQAAGAQHFVARREGDTSLYELGADTVKELRQAVGEVREAQAGKKK
jgi:hypothetical protein